VRLRLASAAPFSAGPELDQALKGGRCTSPCSLHELRKLHPEEPARVTALVAGEAEVTRTTVAAMRAAPARRSSGRCSAATSTN
jgi:hypothetical protein